MPTTPLSEEVQQLGNDLIIEVQNTVQRKLDNMPALIEKNLQDKFIETLLEKGGKIFTEYLNTNLEKMKHEIEKRFEFGIQELQTIDRIDKREKAYKGTLVFFCIIALVLTAFYNVSQTIAPVLGVIIGLLLKSSSISDFYSRGKKNIDKSEKED